MSKNHLQTFKVLNIKKEEAADKAHQQQMELQQQSIDAAKENQLRIFEQEQSQHQPLMSIFNSGRTSRLRFTPRSESDFGTLFCFATNRLGTQQEPCVFNVRRSSKSFPHVFHFIIFNQNSLHQKRPTHHETVL